MSHSVHYHAEVCCRCNPFSFIGWASVQTAAVSVGGLRYFSGFALYVMVIGLSGVQFRE